MTEPPERPEPSSQGGPAEPPARHRRRLAYLIGAAALVVVVVVALVLVFTLGGDDGPTSSPRKAVTALVAAAKADDTGAAAKLVCPTFVVGTQIATGSGPSTANMSGTGGIGLLASLHPADATVTDVRQVRSAAAVDATVTLGGRPTALSFSTEHQQGKWLVCAVQPGVRMATGAPSSQGSAVPSAPSAPASASSDQPSFSTPATPSFPGTSGFPGTPSISGPSGPPGISTPRPGVNGSPAVS